MILSRFVRGPGSPSELITASIFTFAGLLGSSLLPTAGSFSSILWILGLSANSIIYLEYRTTRPTSVPMSITGLLMLSPAVMWTQRP